MKEIHCETLVPEPIIQIPKNEEILTFKIGYRLTNKSSTPYRFELQTFLPLFRTPDGQLSGLGVSRNVRIQV